MHKNYLTSFFLIILIFSGHCYAFIDLGKYHDYRSVKQSKELEKMQEFHLQQAKTKIQNNQTTHAWGDLAYLLCHVPNHHVAIAQMLNLSILLHKETEMQEYLEKALRIYPEDDVVHMLYGAFLHNIGQPELASKHLNLAKKYGNLKTNDRLLKNTAKVQR